MSGTAYIVPTDLLKTAPADPYPLAEWHATPVPADPTQSLVVVIWRNPNAEAEFESQAGVLALGEKWEPLPAAAVPLLASLQDPTALTTTQGATAAIPTTDTPVAPDTVAVSLRKVAPSWPGARLV